MAVIKWDDFTGGEYGGLSPGLQSSNQWTGLNMFVYDDGRVGPRGGMETHVGSGLVATNEEVSAVAIGNYILFHASTSSGHEICRVSRDGGSITQDVLAATSPSAWIPGAWAITGDDEVYLAVYESILTRGGIWRYVPSTTTATSITDTAFTAGVGLGLTTYRGRMYCPEYDSNVLRYSVINDYTDWSTAAGDGTDSGSFVVGDDTPIVWLGVVEDQLWIMKQDQEIWAYQGVPSRDSLRRIMPGRAGGTGSAYSTGLVESPHQFAVLRNNEVVGAENAIPRVSSISPSSVVDYNWMLSKMRDQFSIDIGDVRGSGACATHEMDGAVVAFEDDSALGTRSFFWIKRNGAWTLHEFDPGGIGGTSTGSPHPFGVTCSGDGVLWLLTSADAGGGTVEIWPCSTLLNMNKPGDGLDYIETHEHGDEFSGATEQTAHVDDCTFQTSYYMEPSGKDMTIRRVIIEFVAFDTNSSDTNHFDPTIELRASDDGQEQTVTLDSWDEANASATSSGSPRRHVVTPAGGIQATMFSIKLSEIRGVAIESIRVEFDADDTARR